MGLNTKETANEVTFEVPFAKEAVDLYSGKTYPISENKITISLPSREDGGTILLVDADEKEPTQPTEPETPPTSGETDSETPPPASGGNDVKTPGSEDSKQVTESSSNPNKGKGESLPNTATGTYNLLLIGLSLLLIGAIVFLVQKRKKRTAN